MSDPKKNDLCIIILNYNSQFWLKKCLVSLKKFYLNHSKYQVKVVIIDNASTDASVKVVKKDFKWVTLIELTENLGFAAGNNVALKQCQNLNSRYVMLLNNDIEFTSQSNLDLLIQFMDKNPQAAVLSPKLMLVNGQIDPACHRGEPTPWASFTYFLKLEKLFPHSQLFAQYHQSYKDYQQAHLIDACSGAAMVINTQAIKKVGVLDDRFFMYAEDLDWCRRFRDAGYKIVYLPQVTLIHHKYKSGIKSESDFTAQKIKQYFYQTMLQYYDKYYRHQYPRIVRWLLKIFLFIKRGGV